MKSYSKVEATKVSTKIPHSLKQLLEHMLETELDLETRKTTARGTIATDTEQIKSSFGESEIKVP